MKKCNIARILLIASAIFIAACISYLDFLSIKLYKNITGWNIAHLIWFFIMGYLCPNRVEEFMLIGLLWEVIEKLLGKITNKEKFWTSGGYSGQLVDLMMNFIGYLLGEHIKKN